MVTVILYYFVLLFFIRWQRGKRKAVKIRNQMCICWIGMILSLSTEPKENHLLRKLSNMMFIFFLNLVNWHCPQAITYKVVLESSLFKFSMLIFIINLTFFFFIEKNIEIFLIVINYYSNIRQFKVWSTFLRRILIFLYYNIWNM